MSAHGGVGWCVRQVTCVPALGVAPWPLRGGEVGAGQCGLQAWGLTTVGLKKVGLLEVWESSCEGVRGGRCQRCASSLAPAQVLLWKQGAWGTCCPGPCSVPRMPCP